MAKAILFTNITDTDFTHQWDSVDYTFKAGTSMYMEDWKARHFAKHLADKILVESGLMFNDPSRASILAKILTEDEDEVKTEEQVKDVVINKNKRTKKTKKDEVDEEIEAEIAKEEPKEEEFADLEEEPKEEPEEKPKKTRKRKTNKDK